MVEYARSDNVVKYTIPIGPVTHSVYAMVIPDKLPPSFNDLITKSVEWRHASSRWWRFYLAKHCRAMPPAYLQRRAVRIDIFKKGQRDDDPNLDARSKVILDAMKQVGQLCDDNHKFLDWGRVWQRNHSTKATVILVSDTMDARLLQEAHELSGHALSIVGV